MLNKMDRKALATLCKISQESRQINGFHKGIKLEESGEDSGTCSDNEQRTPVKDEETTSDFSDGEPDLNTDSFMKFHISEKRSIGFPDEKKDEDTFAGRRYVGVDCSTIRSTKGSIRGVKNRVRAGIATFLQMKDSKVRI